MPEAVKESSCCNDVECDRPAEYLGLCQECWEERIERAEREDGWAAW